MAPPPKLCELLGSGQRVLLSINTVNVKLVLEGACIVSECTIY